MSRILFLITFLFFQDLKLLSYIVHPIPTSSSSLHVHRITLKSASQPSRQADAAVIYATDYDTLPLILLLTPRRRVFLAEGSSTSSAKSETA